LPSWVARRFLTSHRQSQIRLNRRPLANISQLRAGACWWLPECIDPTANPRTWREKRCESNTGIHLEQHSISALRRRTLCSTGCRPARTGGFASTLAAAQGLSTASLDQASHRRLSDRRLGPSTEPFQMEARRAASQRVTVVARATVNLQPRKPLTLRVRRLRIIMWLRARGSCRESSGVVRFAKPAWQEPHPLQITARLKKASCTPGLATPEPALNESVAAWPSPAPTDALLGNGKPLVVIPASAPPDSAAISSSPALRQQSAESFENELGRRSRLQ